MADVEACSPPADDPSGGCCKAALRTILLVVAVTIVLSVCHRIWLILLFIHPLASLVAELVAYAAVGCLYIYNSSGSHEKFISAGYIVLVLPSFLLSTVGISLDPEDYDQLSPLSLLSLKHTSVFKLCHQEPPCKDLSLAVLATFAFFANMVVISTYCVWKLSFILPLLANMVAIPLSMKKIMATILHATIVTMLFAVIIVFYVVPKYVVPNSDNDYYTNHSRMAPAAFLVELVAYNAVGCLYIYNSSRQKEKVISAGCLVLLRFVFLLCSLATIDVRIRIDLIFSSNIVAISSYCIWKLYPLLRRWFDALDGDVVPVPRPTERQEEEAVLQLHHQTSFHIQEVLREFSSDEIQAMTQDFGTMIGQGGSAQVFRGNLDDGTPIAVKRINIHGGRTVAGEEDFRRELSIIANVHHRSLVRLLGYCLQHGGGGLYLVYPFFENGSLDRWIFHGSEEQRRQLTWLKRLGIAVDVARALAYLHNECHRRILHLDVKPGNILLDGDLRAHVSDFGISLSITQGVPSVVNTRGRGTLGYMAPEMLVNSVSDRSDVYSYGKTLLELIGGRPNFVAAVPSADDASSSATPDLRRDYFPYIVRDMTTRGELMKAVDAAMAHDGVYEEEVKTLVEVALCCIQEQPDKRPRMQDVVDMLEGRVSVNLPPESHPPSAVIFLDSVSSLSG